MRKAFQPGKEHHLPGQEDYVLLEEIGKGGSGTVYKARQRSSGTVVALKVLHFSDPAVEGDQQLILLRFERECAICSSISHPGIVRLLDKGITLEGNPYAAFEYIPGCSLKQLILQHHALTPVSTGIILGQVLEALAAAHHKGIVHCDLKPQNIMVSDTGQGALVKVLDFGISAILSGEQFSAGAAGTPSYSSPEQLRGESVTPSADLYAWGLIFLECLTGKPVMKGRSAAAIFRQQLSGDEIALPRYMKGHPLAALLQTVLYKDPARRVAGASMLLKEHGDIDFLSLPEQPAPRKRKGQRNNDEEMTTINIVIP